MKIRISMRYPRGGRVEPVTSELLEAVFSDQFNYIGEVGDITMTASDGIGGSVYRNLDLLLKAPDQILIIYQDKDQGDNWLTLEGDLEDSEFLALDQGGAHWKLNIRYLVTTEIAKQVLTRFAENEGLIISFFDWKPFPDDFLA